MAAPECCLILVGTFYCVPSWHQLPLLCITALGNLSHLNNNSKPQAASNLISTITKEGLKIAKNNKILPNRWSYFMQKLFYVTINNCDTKKNSMKQNRAVILKVAHSIPRSWWRSHDDEEVTTVLPNPSATKGVLLSPYSLALQTKFFEIFF